MGIKPLAYNEFIEENNAEELADVFEVLYAIAGIKNISLDEVEKTRLRKIEERGGFEKRIFLEKIIKKSGNPA